MFKQLLDKVDNRKVSLDKAYKQVVKHETLQKFLQLPVSYRNDDTIKLIHGDIQKESLQIQDNSVNLIFTDPPYDEKSLYLYDSLALHGHRVLKAGGSLVTYAGHYAISQIIQYMEARDLHYYWIFAVVHAGPFSSFFAKNIFVKWKPLLWFVKGKRERPHQKVFDLINSTKPNKILHDWEQSPEEARYIIDHLTKPGELVFDPFMGSGTTALAAINLKRKFVGIDIDKGVLEIAKKNLELNSSSAQRELA